MQSDIDLVCRIIEGQADEFNVLMVKYDKKIMSFIYNIIKNKETAEDLTQEVFIAAFYKVHTFRKEYKFSTWLYKIAYNKTIDFIRKNKKITQINMENINLASETVSPEHTIELRETKAEIKEFIKDLKDVDKRILFLRCSEDSLSFSDISHIMNMSESNVKKRYYKVLAAFEKSRNENIKSSLSNKKSKLNGKEVVE